MLSDLFKKLSNVIPIILILTFIQGVYWLFFEPTNQIEWNPSTTSSPEKIKVGDNIIIHREVRINEAPLMVRFDRQLVEVDCNKPCKRFILVSSVRLFEKNGTEEIFAANQIPDYVLPGKYRVEVTATWQVNPLRSHSIKLPTPVVEVTN